MTVAGEKLLAGAREALAVARGEIPAARIWLQGIAYVPEGSVDTSIAIKAMYQFADLTAQHWRNKGAGGPGIGDELERAEQIAVDAISALRPPHPYSSSEEA